MLDVLRKNPGFRLLWASQVVSQLGDWMGRIAIVTLIADLSSSDIGTYIGLLFAVELTLRLLPSVIFGPLAGPLADRMPRRALMVTADLTRALVVLGLTTIDEPGDLPLLYALLVTQMSLSVFFESARSASVPATLAREDLQAGYALSAATWSTVLALGAYIGGELVDRFGTVRVFQLDAATYVLSALLLRSLRMPPVPKHPQAFRWRDAVTFLELRRAYRHACERELLPAIFAKSFWGGAGGFLVLLSLMARERFGLDADGVFQQRIFASAAGVLFLARGLGTGFGPVLTRHLFRSDDASMKRQISVGFAFGAVGYAFFPLAPELWIAFACVLFAHLGGSTIWVSSTVLWQRRAGDAFRGRLFALEMFSLTLAMICAALLAGVLFDSTQSLTTATWAICALVVVGGTGWTVWRRHVDGQPPRCS